MFRCCVGFSFLRRIIRIRNGDSRIVRAHMSNAKGRPRDHPIIIIIDHYRTSYRTLKGSKSKIEEFNTIYVHVHNLRPQRTEK